MQWKDVLGFAEKAAGVALPALGTALAGPLGGSIGGLLAKELGCDNTPDAVAQAVQTNPDAAVKLAKIESDERVALAAQASGVHTAQIQADATTLTAINATIQADSNGRSWLQRNTQSICKLSTVGAVILIYFVLPETGQSVPEVPDDAWLMLGAILGITSWHDGATQTAKVKAASSIAQN